MVAPFASPGALERARFYVAVGAVRRPRHDARDPHVRHDDVDACWRDSGEHAVVTAVAARGGSVIYALTGEHGTVLAIDPLTQHELSAMLVGRAPSLASIAPDSRGPR